MKSGWMGLRGKLIDIAFSSLFPRFGLSVLDPEVLGHSSAGGALIPHSCQLMA